MKTKLLLTCLVVAAMGSAGLFGYHHLNRQPSPTFTMPMTLTRRQIQFLDTSNIFLGHKRNAVIQLYERLGDGTLAFMSEMIGPAAETSPGFLTPEGMERRADSPDDIDFRGPSPKEVWMTGDQAATLSKVVSQQAAGDSGVSGVELIRRTSLGLEARVTSVKSGGYVGSAFCVTDTGVLQKADGRRPYTSINMKDTLAKEHYLDRSFPHS